jgi:hypothetical protein
MSNSTKALIRTIAQILGEEYGTTGRKENFLAAEKVLELVNKTPQSECNNPNFINCKYYKAQEHGCLGCQNIFLLDDNG